MQQAGWYDDPQQVGQLRWWDGTAWTPATMAAPTVSGAGAAVVSAGLPAASGAGSSHPATAGTSASDSGGAQYPGSSYPGSTYPGPSSAGTTGTPYPGTAGSSYPGESGSPYPGASGSSYPGAIHPPSTYPAAQPPVPGYPVAPGGSAPWVPPSPPAGSQYPPASGNRPANLWRSNTYTWIAIGVAILYAVLYTYAHVIFIGILPVAMIVQAFQRRERLAWVALVVGGALIAYTLTHFFLR